MRAHAGAARPTDAASPMSGGRAAGLFVLVLLSGALRFPQLGARPMHADEAIHADRVGSLLEGGGYEYDPKEYHGPTLVYMALVPAALRGQWKYVDLDETTLRLVPAATGVALVLAHLAAAPYVGPAAAAVGALLTALSPAMVYYSRYYIHELPLVLMSLGALLAGAALPAPAVGRHRRLRGRLRGPDGVDQGDGAARARLDGGGVRRGRGSRRRPLVGPGVRHRRGAGWAPGAARRLRRHLALALLAGVAVAAAFFSSFLTHPSGLVDAFRAYGFYLHRGSTWSWHVHPWHYYLGLLVRFPASGPPFWTEAVILALAVVGAVAGWRAMRAAPAAARDGLVADRVVPEGPRRDGSCRTRGPSASSRATRC